MINYTEPKLEDFKCYKLPIDNLPKCKELLILGNVYNFFGTYKDGDLSDFTQTPWTGEGAASNFMNFGQFVMSGGHATIIASKETCNYYRKLYKEFYKAGFGTTHPKVVLFEIDDTKFLKGNFKIKNGKEEKLVKGEYFWAQGKDGKWGFNYSDFLKSFFENGEKKMFDMIIANPPYSHSFYKKIIKAVLQNTKQLSILCPWDLVTAVKGKDVRSALNNHVLSYSQESAKAFGSPLKLILGSFDLTKNTGKNLEPYTQNSIDASIIAKFQKHEHQLRNCVYWSKGITGNNNDPLKCKDFVENSYNRQTLKGVSAVRYAKRLLSKPGEAITSGSWGIRDKNSLELIKASTQSDDWVATVLYIIRLVGDARDMYTKEVSYIPLFTSFEELSLTPEEIERIKNF